MVWFPDLRLDQYSFPPNFDDTSTFRNTNYYNPDNYFAIESLLDTLSGSIRKYSKDTVRQALNSILNHGQSVTSTSYTFGIKRTSLQHYLKKLKTLKSKTN